MSKKKTHDDFVKEVYDLVGDEYSVLGEYINSKAKIKIKHNSEECDYYEYEVKPNNFLSGQRCPKCSGKIKKTHEQYVKELKIKNPNIEVMEEYKTIKTPIKHKCMCGNIWIIRPDSALIGNKCNKCMGNEKHNYKYIKDFIENLGYTLISNEYINNQKKLTFKDKEGYYFSQNFSSLKSGHLPNKFNIANFYTIKNIKLWIKTNNISIELISDRYTGSNNEMKWKCLKDNCGEIFEMDWNNIYSNVNCPYCRGMRVGKSNCLATKNPELAKQWHPTKNGDLTPYDVTCGSGKKVWWRCDKGHEWEVIISSRNYGNGCSECNESKGEKNITIWLINNGVIKISDYEYEKLKNKNDNKYYIPQKTFPNLIGLGGGNLSYDFYLPNRNLLIEYQGEFHDGTATFQTEEQFEKQQEHDKRKREYAINNNISLLEIWYWDLDMIKEILDKELKNLIGISA